MNFFTVLQTILDFVISFQVFDVFLKIITIFLTAANIFLISLFALLGYGEWKKRYKSEANYELARQTIQTFYNIYAKIDLLRESVGSPFILGEVIRDKPFSQVMALMTFIKVQKDEFGEKWPDVIDELSIFRTVIYQSNIVLDADLSKSYEIVEKIVNDIHLSVIHISIFLAFYSDETKIKISDFTEIETQLKMLFSGFSMVGGEIDFLADDTAEDETEKALEQCRVEIERILSPYLNIRY